MHNNSRTLEALVGTFQRPQYLNVGSEEDPVPYSSKLEDRDAFKGKQFSTAQTKTGKLPKDMFDPVMKPLFQDEEYVDRWAYSKQQPDKGKGFLTSDFSKRDEFSLTIRCEQHRQQVGHEKHVQKQAAAKLAAKGAGAAQDAAASGAATAASKSKKDAPLLYDLVFAGDSELCVKTRTDTRNPTLLSKERRYGPLKTAAQEVGGSSAGAVQPPAYGHKNVMDTTYRRSGAFWAQ